MTDATLQQTRENPSAQIFRALKSPRVSLKKRINDRLSGVAPDQKAKRRTTGGSVMRPALEINFALWGMIICIVLKTMQEFSIL
jgi:hypothetical protein